MILNILDLIAVENHFGTTALRYDVNDNGEVNILSQQINSQ